jgi:hypothetical protein
MLSQKKSPGQHMVGGVLLSFGLKQCGLRHFRKLTFSFGLFTLAGDAPKRSGKSRDWGRSRPMRWFMLGKDHSPA